MGVQNELLAAINQIAHERKINPESVIESLKVALVTAYKKDYLPKDSMAEVKAEIDVNTGEIKILIVKTIVKDNKFNDKDLEIALTEAKKLEKNLKVGDKLEIEQQIDSGFGRIAAQSAKQVILQKIREAEKDAVISEFQDKVGKIVSGVVQRVYQGNVIVEVGKATAVMPSEEKIFQEYYKTGETYKFLLKEVAKKVADLSYSSQLILSRSDPEFLVQLFTMEVPEISSGTVEIKGCAREAGSRSKLAVVSNQEGIDPIGSCVGQKGMRILNIQEELSDQNYEEKIDIIEWDEDPAQYVANALSPAKVQDVKLDEKAGTALVYVDEDQLSLAIGKEGQNVRLAHKLTEWKIEINPDSEDKGKGEGEKGEKEEKPKKASKKKKGEKLADKKAKPDKKEADKKEADKKEADKKEADKKTKPDKKEADKKTKPDKKEADKKTKPDKKEADKKTKPKKKQTKDKKSKKKASTKKTIEKTAKKTSEQ